MFPHIKRTGTCLTKCQKGKRRKVNCTLVQALRHCTARTAHRGSRGTSLLFPDHGARRGWGVSVTPRSLFTPGKELVPILQEAVWAPGPVWGSVSDQLNSTAALSWREDMLVCVGMYRYLPLHTGYIYRYLPVSTGIYRYISRYPVGTRWRQ